MSLFPLSEKMKYCDKIEDCDECYHEDRYSDPVDCILEVKDKELDLREKVILRLAEELWVEIGTSRDTVESIILQAVKEITDDK